MTLALWVPFRCSQLCSRLPVSCALHAGCADLSSLLDAPIPAPPAFRQPSGSVHGQGPTWAVGALAPCVLHSLHDLLQAACSMELTCLPGSIQASEVARKRLPGLEGWLPFGVSQS